MPCIFLCTFSPITKNVLGIEEGISQGRKTYFDKSLILPLYPALTDEMLDYVIDAVKSFYESI